MQAPKTQHITLDLPHDLTMLPTAEFMQTLDQALAGQPGRVDINCSFLEQVISGHINLLWLAKSRCEESGVGIHLVSVSPNLNRVLRVLDLEDLYLTDYVDQEAGNEQNATEPGYQPGVLQLMFMADTQSVNEALAEFRAFLGRRKIVGNAAFEMGTVFYEIATNIRLHGDTAKDSQVEFAATIIGQTITMNFVDSGVAFDPTTSPAVLSPDKAIASKQTHGFGLAMVAKMTDKMIYTRRDDRLNVLTLEKSWRSKT